MSYVTGITQEAAYPYIRNYHWTHKIPGNDTASFGMFSGDDPTQLSECIGVLVYVVTGAGEGENIPCTADLVRQWLAPIREANGKESWFIAETFKIFKDRNAVRRIVAITEGQNEWQDKIYKDAGMQFEGPLVKKGNLWSYNLVENQAPAMPTIEFAQDTQTRKVLGIDESTAQHPAKGHIGMWQEAIELYTKPGDTVLDPMSGVGATLIATTMGRNVVCVEKEEKFYNLLVQNYDEMKRRPMLGTIPGTAKLLRGSSQHLVELLNGIEIQDNEENVGNMKGSAYWDSMERIYENCRLVISPNGFMVIVIKGYNRKKKYVDLPQQTIDFLEKRRWKLHDRWRRRLSSLSFWRALESKQKVVTVVGKQVDLIDGVEKQIEDVKWVDKGNMDERLLYEEALVMKPLEALGDIPLVLFSPPYEGILARANPMDHSKTSPRPVGDDFRYTQKEMAK